MLNLKWLSFNVRQHHSNSFLKKYFSVTNLYNLLKPFLIRTKSFQRFCNESLNHSFKFLPDYFTMNERIWLEGLLVDWLQKKIFDKWVRRFLINSSYLFSERVLFNFIVRFYIDHVNWAVHEVTIFDLKTVSNLLILLVMFIIFLLLTLNLFYVASFL